MTSLTNAFNYCALAIRETFKRPSVLRAYLVFLSEGLLAGGIIVLLMAGCLAWLGTRIISLVLIGVLLGLLLISLLYLVVLLQTRVIRAYLQEQTQPTYEIPSFPGFKTEVLRYLLAYPWLPGKAAAGVATSEANPDANKPPHWTRGKHLLLPVLTLHSGQLEQAQDQIETQTLFKPLRFDPGQVNVHLLAWLAPLIFGLVGLLLGWLVARGLISEPFVLVSSQILASALAMLVFLACFQPALGLAGISLGFYHADLYRLETYSEIPDGTQFLPGLLGKIFSPQASS
ncbi:MAG: hypothetical protein WA110_03335 [Anaerolineaceae bacterium]